MIKCFVVAHLWMLFLIVALSQAQTSIVLGSEENSLNVEISELVLKEAYDQAGIPMEIKRFPSLRSLIMTNDGDLDGQVNRVFGIEKDYSNLVMVPVVINNFTFYAFVKRDKTLSISAWDWGSLSPYSLVSRRGIKIIEMRTNGMKLHVVNG